MTEVIKKKIDFVSTTMSIQEFMVEFKTKMKQFIPHHVDMKWQQRDWRWVKRHFPRGTWACVQDFSENYTVEVRSGFHAFSEKFYIIL